MSGEEHGTAVADPNGKRGPSSSPVSDDGHPAPARRAGGRRRADNAFEDLLDSFTTHLDDAKYLKFSSVPDLRVLDS